MDIVRSKLMLVTIGTSKVKGLLNTDIFTIFFLLINRQLILNLMLAQPCR